MMMDFSTQLHERHESEYKSLRPTLGVTGDPIQKIIYKKQKGLGAWLKW
jgi:hypothetical protein